jgi:hypothetical protein
MLATGTDLSQVSHGLDGRYATMATILDTQQDADLRFWIAGALAGQAPLIYGSEGWGFETFRARWV